MLSTHVILLNHPKYIVQRELYTVPCFADVLINKETVIFKKYLSSQ